MWKGLMLISIKKIFFSRWLSFKNCILLMRNRQKLWPNQNWTFSVIFSTVLTLTGIKLAYAKNVIGVVLWYSANCKTTVKLSSSSSLVCKQLSWRKVNRTQIILLCTLYSSWSFSSLSFLLQSSSHLLGGQSVA